MRDIDIGNDVINLWIPLEVFKKVMGKPVLTLNQPNLHSK